MAAFSNLVPQMVQFGELNPLFTAVFGGLLMGTGMLILFRHRSSLGGFNVLVLYLQERFGWRAGRIQMALDCSIVLCAFALTDWQHIALSVLGAVAAEPDAGHQPPGRPLHGHVALAICPRPPGVCHLGYAPWRTRQRYHPPLHS